MCLLSENIWFVEKKALISGDGLPSGCFYRINDGITDSVTRLKRLVKRSWKIVFVESVDLMNASTHLGHSARDRNGT
jgi:hypothetical protein